MIDHLKEILRKQLENNHIKPGTKKAGDFEYAFLVGAFSQEMQHTSEPPAALGLALMRAAAGHSILQEK